ncbi:MAG: trimethylamine methyltransferase family protein [Thermoleophilaceae bacterium]
MPDILSIAAHFVKESFVFANKMPRYEILSEEAMGTLDRGWRRIVSELGVEFALPEAVEYFEKAGQRVEGEKVYLDPEFVLEQVAKAPSEFELQARNPDHTLQIGGDGMAFAGVYGPPFVRRGEARGDAHMDDFENFVRLGQSFPEMDSAGGTVVEPEDRPLDSRHLDMVYALQTLSDKPYMGSVISAENARDTIEMGKILFGGDDALQRAPVSISLINCNSPLRWDDRMLSAMLEYNRANQAVVTTPFLLMGAMSPVAIPATLVQQMAEALSGIALTQLVQPGCPVVFGSFLSNTDMQSGSPSFGTPESAIGLLCTGQIARHFNLPWRSGGGLTSSQTPDAQAAYEALMTMLPTFLAGANFVMHAAGWLEGGLVSSYEKYIVDIEILRMLKHEFQPLEVNEDTLAFGAHEEVGSGGHFLGAAHTLEHFRTCFYRPLLSSTENFDRWTKNGGADAAERAGRIAQETLDAYEQPPIDDAVRGQLRDYVARRRIELGDEPIPSPAF